MKKIEIILGIIFLSGVILQLLLIPGGAFLSTISGLALSSIYFYLGIFIFLDIKFKKWFKRESYKDKSSQKIFGAVVTGTALSTVTIGILFMYQSLPGSEIMILVGGLPLVVILVVSLIKFIKTKSKYYSGIIIRISIVALFYFIHMLF